MSALHDSTSYEAFLREKLVKLRDFVEAHSALEQSRQKEFHDKRTPLSIISKFHTEIVLCDPSHREE